MQTFTLNKVPSISESESSILSTLRVVAMWSIVCCHILQTFDNNWAWILNVGVQIFLVLSGYLYGHKEITNWKNWYISRIKKIYTPYFFYICFFFIFYCFTDYEELSFKCITTYLLGLQGLAGGGIRSFGHLWFITAIGVGYLITPILQYLRKYASLVLFALFVITLVEYYVCDYRLQNFSWILLYATGYYIPNVKDSLKVIITIICVTLFLGSLTNLDWELIRKGAIQNTILHNSIGLILILMCHLFARVNHTYTKSKVLAQLDALSYYVFLVHVPFVRPPHDILQISSILPLNIVIALTFTILTAIVLKKITEFVLKYLNTII